MCTVRYVCKLNEKTLYQAFKELTGKSTVSMCCLINWQKLFPNKQTLCKDRNKEVLSEDEYDAEDGPVWGLEFESFFDK